LRVRSGPSAAKRRPHLTETLNETGRGSGQSPRSRGFRGVLVISEIALAMVLLVGAGLMVRTLAHLSRVDLGFNPAHILTLRAPLSGDRYKQPQAQVKFSVGITTSTRRITHRSRLPAASEGLGLLLPSIGLYGVIR
jgi:hypothetical protein